MKRYLIPGTVVLLFLSIPALTLGQNTMKLRLSGNISQFLKEPRGEDSLFTEVKNMIDPANPFSEFKNQPGVGIEAELMRPLSKKAWIGLEVGSRSMRGKNDYPGLFNFQYTDLLQLYSVNNETQVKTFWKTNFPLEYKTSLISILGNVRFYPAPDGSFRPFLKASAGISLISTELSLKDPASWNDAVVSINENDSVGPPVLYARGTADAQEGRVSAFTVGGGVGFEYQINDKISLYADGTYLWVNSDIVDGRPNFDYDKETGMLYRFNTRSDTRSFPGSKTGANTLKISFGITYAFGKEISPGGSRSGGKGYDKADLPFYRKK